MRQPGIKTIQAYGRVMTARGALMAKGQAERKQARTAGAKMQTPQPKH